jgi:outer membrane usher protein
MPILSALSINKNFAIGMAILAAGACCANSYAQDNPASFNSSFLMGSARDMDTSLYSHGNPVSPGEYRLDMYVNGQWFGKQDIVFKSVRGKKKRRNLLYR